MDPNALWHTIEKSIVGSTLKLPRLAGNSLMCYFDCEPEDMTAGHVVWFEPPWHVTDNKGVLVGSQNVQLDNEICMRESQVRVCDRLRNLDGRKVVSIDYESIAKGLHMVLSGDYDVRSFVSHSDDDNCWHIRDNAGRFALYGTAKRLETVALIENS